MKMNPLASSCTDPFTQLSVVLHFTMRTAQPNMAVFEVYTSRSRVDLLGRKWPEYANADTYGPIPSMPFLDSMPAVRQAREAYWKVDPTEPGLYIDARGRAWPDFLHCYHPPPSVFVSDKVLSDLEAEGIPVGRKTEFPIAKIKGKRLRDLPHPRYFVVEPHPGISIDYEASGVAVDSEGKPVFTREQILNGPPLKLDLASWDGTDFFTFRNLGSGSHLALLCTERVVEIAKREQWKCVSFKPQSLI